MKGAGLVRQAIPRPANLSCIQMAHHYKGRIVCAGRIRNGLGEPGHLFIPVEAVEEAVEQGLFEGVACFIDHAGPGQHGSLRNLFGTWHSVDFNYETGAAEGILSYYPNAETDPIAARLDQYLAGQRAGEATPDIGVSLVFYPEFIRQPPGEEGPLQVARFLKVESADLVFSPAAGGRILEALSASFENGGNQMMNDAGAANGRARQAPLAKAKSSRAAAGEQPEAAARLNGMSAETLGTVAEIAADTADAVAREQARLTAAEVAQEMVELRLGGYPEEQVVRLEGPPPRGRISGMRLGSDDVSSAVGWLFGAPGAATPEPGLRDSSQLYRLLTGDIYWRGVFDPAEALATANATTLADLAVNAMNKVIVASWDSLAVYRWYELVVTVQPNDGSLQNMAWIQFGGIADLPVVAEGAAYSEATVADSRENDAFSKYGVYVGITRKMLRNSEIAKIQAIPRALAVAAVRTRESKIAGLFTANSGAGPTLDNDSTALFHANHSNLATTAFSYAAWSAARLECYKATEANSSKRLGFWPKFWLGPADLYDTALETFGYGAGPGGKPGTPNNDVNPFAASRPGDPRPTPIAVPSFTDSNDWAYLVDPALQPVIQMSYAQSPGGGGHPLPELFSVVSESAGLMFSNDTMPIKVRDEFAYGVSGYRGIGKRNVA